MGLTVKEKDHWRERIARRIDQTIDELECKEDPTFRQRLAEKADSEAWKSLGLGELHAEVEKINAEIKRSEDRRSEIYDQMLRIVEGTSETTHYYRSRGYPCQVTESVKRHSLVHQRELMASDPLGKRILQLEREKEELLDTVWLATSSAQIKDLWSRFIDMLNWEPPELQRQTLASPPAAED